MDDNPIEDNPIEDNPIDDNESSNQPKEEVEELTEVDRVETVEAIRAGVDKVEDLEKEIVSRREDIQKSKDVQIEF